MIPSIIVVTGTDTDVGKTVAAAAIAAILIGRGSTVAAYKPTQTGVTSDEPGDMDMISQLVDIRTTEGVRLLAPMAPRAAAFREGVALPTLTDYVQAIEELSRAHDYVIIEGAGGLLVELTDGGETLADLATTLTECGVVLVARNALGMLNQVALSREALTHRGIQLLGVIIGAWPKQPSEIELDNRDWLADTPLLGALPTGMSMLGAAEFTRSAPSALAAFNATLGT